MIVCVLLPQSLEAEGPAAAVVAALLESAPRVVVEAERAWLDVRGLDAEVVHRRLAESLRTAGVEVRCGAGARPVVAEAAAREAAAGALVRVPAGGERACLAELSLMALGVPEPLLGWLADVGVGTCGELASVAREAVEVRFGGEAVRWWRLARGDDERRLFVPVPPEPPQASVDFVDYVVTDPERLVFTVNALLGGVCEQLRERGVQARRLRLRLPLADGTVWERTLRSARPTADRAAWLRLARTALERLTVPDAVAGASLQVESTEAAASVQGDLFDAGFATAGAVEAAVARLLEDHGPVLREPGAGGHVLAEQRAEYRALDLREAVHGRHVAADDVARRDGVVRRRLPEVGDVSGGEDVARPPEPVGLTLQLLPEPRAVAVETEPRRDHRVPTRYRDGGWHELLSAAGPDRVSGGQWEATYAREYYRAVRGDGVLVWLFHDAGEGRWYLHGWWD